MATPNRFFLNGFPITHKKKTSLAHRVGAHVMKNAGPQNGDSTRDCEGQARIQIGENLAFD